jgi:hypothetical protein
VIMPRTLVVVRWLPAVVSKVKRCLDGGAVVLFGPDRPRRNRLAGRTPLGIHVVHLTLLDCFDSLASWRSP